MGLMLCCTQLCASCMAYFIGFMALIKIKYLGWRSEISHSYCCHNRLFQASRHIELSPLGHPSNTLPPHAFLAWAKAAGSCLQSPGPDATTHLQCLKPGHVLLIILSGDGLPADGLAILGRSSLAILAIRRLTAVRLLPIRRLPLGPLRLRIRLHVDLLGLQPLPRESYKSFTFRTQVLQVNAARQPMQAVNAGFTHTFA